MWGRRGGWSVRRMACRTSRAPCSCRVGLPVHQLRRLFRGGALSQRGGSRRSWWWRLSFSGHPRWYTSLPLGTGGSTGGTRKITPNAQWETPKTRNEMTVFFFSYLDAVLLVGDSLLLLLLFMACRVCLSVVCRVCLSVPCLVSLSVRPWMAL